MPMFIILMLCWIPISWLVHAFLHENSHATVARYFGFRTTIRVFPDTIEGRWRYASFTMTRETRPTLWEQKKIFSAPVLPALIWTLFFGLAGWAAEDETARACFALEGVLGGLDLTVWLLSLARCRAGTDGAMWSEAVDPLGAHRNLLRVIGGVCVTLLIAAMAVTTWFQIVPAMI